jgi:hypothetical protein
MNRSLDARLRGLEAKATARPVHIIWSDTSDRTEWDRKKADLIASAKASDGDKFLLVGWQPRKPAERAGTRQALTSG